MGSSSSSESLNGLKFGRKIYFEDSSSSSGPAQPKPAHPKKVRSGPVQPGQPPRCQVEGCLLDLSDAKTYYSRHKVCGAHSKSPKVTVNGIEQRFCQQCSRYYHYYLLNNIFTCTFCISKFFMGSFGGVSELVKFSISISIQRYSCCFVCGNISSFPFLVEH